MPDARPPLEYVHIADAIVHDRTGALLVVNRDDGTWWIPGGRVELGETFAEAAVREVAEETGVVVRFEGIACVVETSLRDQHAVFATCVTTMLGGEAHVTGADPKIVGVRWVDLAEAATLLPDHAGRDVILRTDPPHVPHYVDPTDHR